jgi:predicted outer membrane repeat protein
MKKLAFSLLIFVPIIVFGHIINIPADYSTIQEGIDAAVDGDTVLVQPDLYLEHLVIQDKNITLASLFLTTGDSNYIATTVIDGDTSGRVLFMENLTEETKLIGFTLRNGKVAEEFGGGIHITSASPIISDMIISNNTALRGGGIYSMNSVLFLTNVVFKENSGDHRGGGIKADNNDIFMESCVFTDNNSPFGAAMHYSAGGEPGMTYVVDINSCLISENVSTIQTSGFLFFKEDSNAMLELMINECNFLDNTGNANGALQIRGDNLHFKIQNCKFIGNTVTNYSAAGAFVLGCEGEMLNCLIASNIAATGGGNWNTGGFTAWAGVELIMNNCTFTDNQASYGSGMTIGPESIVYTTNCIFWGNSNDQIALLDNDDIGGAMMIDYSDVQYGLDSIRVDPFSTLNWGGHNTDEDPLFLGTGEDAYTLTAGSGCIDTGIPDTSGMDLPPYDLMGNVRVWDGSGGGTAIIDMGPYEYGAPVWVGIEDKPTIQQEEEISLYVYPNPCSEFVHLRYEISDRQLMICDLYTITGKKIKRLLDEEQIPGKYELEIDVDDLSPGIYFIRLQSGDLAGSGKMILVK